MEKIQEKYMPKNFPMLLAQTCLAMADLKLQKYMLVNTDLACE